MRDVTTFLGILTVIAQLFVVSVVVSWIVQRSSSRRPLDVLTGMLGSDALRLAAFVAVVATAGSLFMSEVRGFTPCELCWYQRIAMYPLAVILPVAAARGDRQVWRYVVPVALIGLTVSIYHVQLEWFPDQDHLACSLDVPCTVIWFREFGYITIPMMAGSAFAAIVALLGLGARHGQGISKQA